TWLAQVSFTHDSWTAPLDVRRVPPHADAHVAAAEQIRALVAPRPADAPVPWCVFDAGYDPEPLARALGDLDGARVAVLVRLRGGRCAPAPGWWSERRTAPAAWGEVRLRRRADLVGADRRAPGGASPVRPGPRPGLGWRARQKPAPPGPRQSPHAPDPP